MRSLRIFFLLATSSLAADNTNYYKRKTSDTILPIDYYDDIYNQDIKIDRDSKFSFNFEQIRHDQPPQIEIREENVGRYFNTRPQTTTPFPVKDDEEFQHVHPKLTTTEKYYSEIQENQQQRSTIPPPPRFAFSRPQNRHPNVRKNLQSDWNVPTAHHNTRAKNLENVYRMPNIHTPHSSPKQWTLPSTTQGTPLSYFTSTQKYIDEVLLSPPNSHIPDTNPSNKFPKRAPSLSNRGTRKFNRNDIKRREENTSAMNDHRGEIPQKTTTDRVSTPHSIRNNPPPPVPTLSPWYDNFGK